MESTEKKHQRQVEQYIRSIIHQMKITLEFRRATARKAQKKQKKKTLFSILQRLNKYHTRKKLFVILQIILMNPPKFGKFSILFTRMIWNFPANENKTRHLCVLVRSSAFRVVSSFSLIYTWTTCQDLIEITS